MILSWLILLFAICFEVAGTLTLKFTNGMTRLWPTLLMFALYLLSLFGLTQAVTRIPVGTAYAVWSGLGTLIVAVIGALWFKEQVTLLRCLSAAFIIAGIAGLYLTAAE
ncbi:MAG: multidrug efflux SMR transporter [Acidobacteriota bacterium]